MTGETLEKFDKTDKILQKIYYLVNYLTVDNKIIENLSECLIHNIKFTKEETDRFIDNLLMIVPISTINAISNYLNKNEQKLNINDYTNKRFN